MANANSASGVSEKKKLNIKHMQDKDNEKVKGIFRFHEVPGGQMSFVYKAYKGDPVERYDMIDGQVYTIPLGVAKHLNKDCWYPEYEHFKDEQTQNVMRVGKKVRRCSFQSLEFVDIEDFSDADKKLVTVEHAGA